MHDTNAAGERFCHKPKIVPHPVEYSSRHVYSGFTQIYGIVQGPSLSA
jgi:hypothetical protein